MQKLLIVLLALSNLTYGQSSPPVQNNNTSAYRLRSDTNRLTDIRERLVQLAMQNPNYEIADHQATMAEYQVRLAKGTWLSLLVISGNVNEFTINKGAAGSTNGVPNTIYYPKYNIGLSIPFDIFSRQINSIKIARENYMIAQAIKNDRFRQIKVDILTRYEDFLLNKQILEFQIQLTQDEFTLYKRSEKDFQDGIIKLEEFNKAYKTWADAQINKLSLQRNQNVIKLEIERIIGVKLDDVLAGR